MRNMIRCLEMPLLGKELTELAAHKRTWVFRVLAVLGVMVAFMAGWVDVGLLSDGFQRPGVGRFIFNFLVGGLFGALFVFIPLAMCGTVAGERERGTLDLLLLTHQSQWRIIWQKYLGNLVPFFTLLLAAMPMMAICYALGGLSYRDILAVALLLIVTCLQVGALTMVGSALCRSTAMAFFTSLAVGLFYFCGPLVVVAICDALTSGRMRPDLAWGVWFLPQNHFSWQGSCNWGFVTVPVLVSWIPAAVSVPLLLGIARFYLERDAQALVVRWCRVFLARLQKRIRPSIKAGVRKIFGRFKPTSLPGDEPITWRETSRVFYARKDVMVGLAVVLALVVLGILGVGIYDRYQSPLGRLLMDVPYSWISISRKQITELDMELWIWGIGVGLLLIRGITAFLTDRRKQTLPVLLTTPLTGSEIVLQKVRGIYGFMWALAVPLAIVVALRLFAIKTTVGEFWVLALGTVSCMLIYGHLFTWFGVWIGLRYRNFLLAMVVAVIEVGLWIFAPFASWVMFLLGHEETSVVVVVALITMISPAPWVFLLVAGHEIEIPNLPFWLLIIVSGAIQGAILYVVRRHVLRNADNWLGRVSEPRRKSNIKNPNIETKSNG